MNVLSCYAAKKTAGSKVVQNLRNLAPEGVKKVGNPMAQKASQSQEFDNQGLVGNILKASVLEQSQEGRSLLNYLGKVVTCGTDSVGSRIDFDVMAKKVPQAYSEYTATTTLQEIGDAKKGSNDDGLISVTMRRNKGQQKETFNVSLVKNDIPVNDIEVQRKTTNKKASILDNKGKLIAVVEDGHYVLMGNKGQLTSKDGSLKIKGNKKTEVERPKVINTNFEKLNPMPSIGKGGEVIIGLQNGRFCEAIIDSLQEFERKINDEEIVLPQFKAQKGAKTMQVTILSGGYGSRAEYTNASSEGIYHHDTKPQGAQNTKGSFRMATGLTPIETTLVTLHKAGILDCSKGVFGIGKNLKFYKNDSSINKGNGGFTLRMYDKMKKEGMDSIFVLPNDSVSRMTKATTKAQAIINSGNAAIVMIASQVPWEKAKGNFGIMKLEGDMNEIKEFAEKPKERINGFIDEGENCYTNTFQFMVHKDALKAINILEPYFKTKEGDKESRDWSKQLLPALMSVSQYEKPQDMRDHFLDVSGLRGNKDAINVLEDTPDEILLQAKEALNGKKVYAVKSKEPWIDAGQFDAMYDVSLKIASGEFELEPFEMEHARQSINLETGLVTTSPELKKEVEQNYHINGRFMAVDKMHNVTTQDTIDLCVQNGSLFIDKD